MVQLAEFNGYGKGHRQVRQGCGHVEIEDQKSVGFVVRALEYGGLDFEGDTPKTLAEAMPVLEAALSEWFEKAGRRTRLGRRERTRKRRRQ